MLTDQSTIQSVLHDVGAQLAAQLPRLSHDLTNAMADGIPELPHDPVLRDMLDGSVAANLEEITHLFRGRVPVEEVRAPVAAVEYARRLAQRGTAPNALLRAYRIGQQLVLLWAHERVQEGVGDTRVALDTLHTMTDLTFRYIDTVSEEVTSAYQTERDRWLANRGAVQRDMVDALVRGDRVDPGVAETALGYRLRGHHLGVVVWTDGDLADLQVAEPVLTRIAAVAGASTAPLVVPQDRTTAWAWLPLARASAFPLPHEELARLVEQVPGVRVALGTVRAGSQGFRDSHHEAVAAHAVSAVDRHRRAPVASFGDARVRAASLLVHDLAATRRLVRDTLGALAEPTPAADKLRETVLTFVEHRENYTDTAAAMHLHKNTIKYRIDKAVEVRGRDLAHDRLDLQLALTACAWFGSEVLTPPVPTGPRPLIP